MKKHFKSLVLVTVIMLSLFTVCANAAITISAQSRPQLYVNGNRVELDSYNINGNNYFKLRDIAYCLNGTECQFGVDWQAASNCINLTTKCNYLPTGGECNIASSGTYALTVCPSTAKVTVNNKNVSLTAYNINGNNYYKLRDLGNVLGFGVSWVADTNSILVYTNSENQNTQIDTSYSDYVNEVVRLVNVARNNNGLHSLTADASLNQAASVRAEELNSLFSHTRPDGRKCFTVLDDMNINYRSAAENIAIGQRTPQEVVDGWLNSPGHYANIMKSNINKIGIGVVPSTTSGYNGYAWVQLFTN